MAGSCRHLEEAAAGLLMAELSRESCKHIYDLAESALTLLTAYVEATVASIFGLCPVTSPPVAVPWEWKWLCA